MYFVFLNPFGSVKSRLKQADIVASNPLAEKFFCIVKARVKLFAQTAYTYYYFHADRSERSSMQNTDNNCLCEEMNEQSGIVKAVIQFEYF